MSKIVCYTAIVGKYDQLHDPIVVSSNVDYICFTDQKFDVNVWQCKPIPTELHHLSNVKTQRVLKICPHRYLKEYDISLWIDGNIQIVGDIVKFISLYDLSKNPLYVRIHPTRNCIYKEAEAVLKFQKDNIDVVIAQIEKYKKAGYPKNIGMVETGILLRKHNDINCIRLCNCWAEELLENSHRDQLSFNYVCWKNRYVPGIMSDIFKINNDYFKCSRHK